MQEKFQQKDGKGGVIKATGASMGAINGADGGDGTVTINEVDSVLNYPTKQLTMHVNDTYQIDESKVSYTKLNDMQTDEITVGNLKYEIVDQTIVNVDENGLITANNIGIAKVKITDETNGYTTYIVVNVLKEIAKSSVKQGDEFTIALKENGTVWSFGANANGELGNGKELDSNEPVQVLIAEGIGLDEIIRIDARKNSSIALNKNGEVYIWGAFSKSELTAEEGKNKTVEKKNYAEKVQGLENIIAVSTNGDNFFAVNQAGDAFIWGSGYNEITKIEANRKFVDVDGELLLGEDGRVYNKNDIEKPLLFLNSILEMSNGEDHNLFVTLRGNAYGMGRGEEAQLGDTKNKTSKYSSLVIGESGILENILEVSAGSQSSMVLDFDGKVYVFGDNTNHKLGIDTVKAGFAVELTKLQDKDGIEIDLKNMENVEISKNHAAISDEEGFVYTIRTKLKRATWNKR